MTPLSELILEALFHLQHPSPTSLLQHLTPELPPSRKTGLPPSVERAVLAFAQSENNLFLNPAMMTTECVEESDGGLLESAVVAFCRAIQSTQGRRMAQPPLSFVAHDREMLRFGRVYGSTPAPNCARGEDCCVNRVRMCPPGRCLQVYLPPELHDKCIEDPRHLETVGSDLCLLCIRSMVAALTMDSRNKASRLPVPAQIVPPIFFCLTPRFGPSR